jgi:tetratricopeptide (TPR) repeat protein
VDKDSLFDYGITAGMRGETDKAIESFEQVIKLDPEYVPALYQLGKTYLKRGDFPAAVRALTRAAEKRPYQAAIHIDLGNAYLFQNALDRAQTEFTKALALEDGNMKAITGLAQVYLKSEEWDRAASHAKLVLLNNPMNFAALFILGAASHHLGHAQESHEALQKATDIITEFVTLKPEQVEGHVLLGEIYLYQAALDRTNLAKAVEHYELAENEAGDASSFSAFGLMFSRMEIQAKLGACYKRLGNIEKAQAMGKRILERDPDNKLGQNLAPE